MNEADPTQPDLGRLRALLFGASPQTETAPPHMSTQEAIEALLSLPPLPLGDGIYYQPGGQFDTTKVPIGTPYRTIDNKPVVRIGRHIHAEPLAAEQARVAAWIALHATGAQPNELFI